MIFVKFYPSQVKALFNTIIIMFFSGFPTLSYPIQPNATTSIGYTKPYGNSSQSNYHQAIYRSSYLMSQTRYSSKNWVFKSRYSFKVRQLGQQLLYFEYKVCWTLYEMGGAPSLSEPCLWIQPPLQFPTESLSYTSANFNLNFPLLFKQIITAIHTYTPFHDTATFSHLPTFACKHPSNLYQKCFPFLSHLPNSGYVKRQRSYGVLWGFLISLFFFKVWEVITGLTITDSLLLRLIKLVYCR